MNTSLLSLSNLSNQQNQQNQPNIQGMMDLSKMNYNTMGLDAVLFPDNKHSELVAKVNNLLNDTLVDTDLLCDKDCQKDRKESQLYQAYVNAKNNLTNAPKSLEISERDYITFSKGGLAYHQQQENMYRKKADSIIKSLTDMYNVAYKQASVILNTYKDQVIYSDHVEELSNTYSNKVTKLKSDVENTKSSFNVANRLTEYKMGWIEIFQQINTYINRIFVILFLLFTAISLYYKKYNTKVFQYAFTIMLFLWIVPVIKIAESIYLYIFRLAE
jgi:hypothetical protein